MLIISKLISSIILAIGGALAISNIEKIKMEAEILQNKAETKRQLLKQEKGTGNINAVDNLNNEISNLYIESIQAKLQILKKIGK